MVGHLRRIANDDYVGAAAYITKPGEPLASMRGEISLCLADDVARTDGGDRIGNVTGPKSPCGMYDSTEPEFAFGSRSGGREINYYLTDDKNGSSAICAHRGVNTADTDGIGRVPEAVTAPTYE